MEVQYASGRTRFMVTNDDFFLTQRWSIGIMPPPQLAVYGSFTATSTRQTIKSLESIQHLHPDLLLPFCKSMILDELTPDIVISARIDSLVRDRTTVIEAAKNGLDASATALRLYYHLVEIEAAFHGREQIGTDESRYLFFQKHAVEHDHLSVECISSVVYKTN